jgi:MoaA/NifB/PqqE/SkfB family radical SAM enzyme
MYGSLEPLLVAARAAGLRTTVTTNGMLLTARRLAILRDRLDLLAISLDGVPESHNRMRAHHGAFELMARNIAHVRDSGIPFGFIFTLTQHNANELQWVANFACEAGARLLQIHPIEEAGRARDTLPGSAPDRLEAAFGYLLALRLQEAVGSTIAIHVDLADAEGLRSFPERVFAAPDTRSEDAPLAEVLTPLVVEADGTVVPLQWGFPRRYALGNLQDASLGQLARRWRRETEPSFRALCRQVFEDASSGPPLFNWYAAVAAAGRNPAVAAV